MRGAHRSDRLNPFVDQFRKFIDVSGWLTEFEGGLLTVTSTFVASRIPEPTIVEIGSYVGRSTVCLAAPLVGSSGRLYAIDPHEGKIDGRNEVGSTLAALRATLESAGVADVVDVIVAKSTDVKWTKPIHFLFIDGWHNEASVRADFEHFAPHVVMGGFVAFHDYEPNCPGVMAVVDQILARGSFGSIAAAHTLRLLQRRGS